MSDLPDISFVDTDATEIHNNLITVYEGLSERKLFPADPIRLFLLSIAKLIAQQRVLIDIAKKKDQLQYAKDIFLDYVGDRNKTTRLPAARARTTVRFTLAAARPSVVTIPQGTRATGNGSQLYFETIEVVEIQPGSLYVDVSCTCSEAGEVGNNFLEGQLDTLVDLIPFVASVQNITESSGGAEVEEDELYRERIRNAPKSFSTAGPIGAYEYWAKSASSAIIDAGVSSPSDSVVQIVPLLAGGEIPTEDVLDAVVVALNDKTIRPLTDKVEVVAPTTKSYTIDLTYWISKEMAAQVSAIQSNVAQAANDYILWQRSKLGRAVNPSELIRRIMVAGAHRVNVVSPIYTAVGVDEVAITTDPAVTYGGMVDD